MFICDICGTVSEPSEKCNVVPVETRVKTYDCGTVGVEIVREAKVCHSCLQSISTR